MTHAEFADPSPAWEKEIRYHFLEAINQLRKPGIGLL